MNVKHLVFDILALLLATVLWLAALVEESPLWFVLAFSGSILILLMSVRRAMKE